MRNLCYCHIHQRQQLLNIIILQEYVRVLVDPHNQLQKMSFEFLTCVWLL
jgi:hypothetical protein